MAITETKTLTIICDNPNCPGNDLPTNDLTGWILVSAEVYGQPTAPQRVFCSADCAATFTSLVATTEQQW